jgi:glycosyltransferase involved in cell wall biosynthesis
LIVTIVCDVLGPENNGTTIAAMNLIRFLKQRGHQVRVVCPDKDREGQEGFYVVPTLPLGPFRSYVEHVGVTIARGDRAVLEAAIADADVVHIMLPFLLGTAALRCAKALGKPVTAGFHCQAENITSHVYLMNSPVANDLTYRAMYRLFYRHVDAIHYPTQFIREVFEAEVGPTPGHVISNGVNSRFVHREAERPAEWAGRFVILSTGRFGKEKCQHVLIRAAGESRYRERIQLVLAGTGPLRPQLEELGRSLPNPPVLRFFGREELLAAINSADLYVHAAEVEIEAISCLEAISCGLVPVISDSPRSATRYFALGPRNLFACNDPVDLAARIHYWMEHPEEKAACSRDYVGYAQRFEQGACMDAMERMIAETAERVRRA